MTETRILVGHERFNVGTEYDWLAGRDEDGAVVTFTGKVRNHNLGDSVKALTLEHYPGMTEKSLAAIVEEARGRWPLGRVTVIHRIGEMWPAKKLYLSASPAPIAGVLLRRGSSSWITSKLKRRSGSVKRRRKVSAGWNRGQRQTGCQPLVTGFRGCVSLNVCVYLIRSESWTDFRVPIR